MNTTAWTMICAAQQMPEEATGRRECLNYMAETYQEPVRAMMRAWGLQSDADIDDAAQDYFHAFLEKNWLDCLERGRGSFRGFLKVSVRNFLLNRKDKINRRPAEVPIAQEAASSEVKGVVLEGASDDTPEDAFNREWARQIMAEAINTMEESCRKRELPHYWQVFERHVIDPEAFGNPSVRDTAEALKMSETDVTNYLHRSRNLFAETVRFIIGETVNSKDDIEKELADLRRYFC